MPNFRGRPKTQTALTRPEISKRARERQKRWEAEIGNQAAALRDIVHRLRAYPDQKIYLNIPSLSTDNDEAAWELVRVFQEFDAEQRYIANMERMENYKVQASNVTEKPKAAPKRRKKSA